MVKTCLVCMGRVVMMASLSSLTSFSALLLWTCIAVLFLIEVNCSSLSGNKCSRSSKGLMNELASMPQITSNSGYFSRTTGMILTRSLTLAAFSSFLELRWPEMSMQVSRNMREVCLFQLRRANWSGVSLSRRGCVGWWVLKRERLAKMRVSLSGLMLMKKWSLNFSRSSISTWSGSCTNTMSAQLSSSPFLNCYSFRFSSRNDCPQYGLKCARYGSTPSPHAQSMSSTLYTRNSRVWNASRSNFSASFFSASGNLDYARISCSAIVWCHSWAKRCLETNLPPSMPALMLQKGQQRSLIFLSSLENCQAKGLPSSWVAQRGRSFSKVQLRVQRSP